MSVTKCIFLSTHKKHVVRTAKSSTATEFFIVLYLLLSYHSFLTHWIEFMLCKLVVYCRATKEYLTEKVMICKYKEYYCKIIGARYLRTYTCGILYLYLISWRIPKWFPNTFCNVYGKVFAVGKKHYCDFYTLFNPFYNTFCPQD